LLKPCTFFVFPGSSRFPILLVSLTFLAATTPAFCQQAERTPQAVTLTAAADTTAALPDAPSASLISSSSSEIASQPQETSSGFEDGHRTTTATVRAKFIFPGQIAPHLTPTDKVYMGLIHGVSLYSAVGWVVAAEYEQVTNGTPNYGTDTGAYGQRLGAAALRGYSEEVLGTSVLAPILHEDPRYYKMGNRHNVAVRTAYAVTRTIITRDDNGHLTPNFSLVGGNLAGAALTNAYYPDFNRGFNQTLKTFEGSMGGAAFGFFANEFLKDKILNEGMIAIHLKQR
jgi:hypothetical protein